MENKMERIRWRKKKMEKVDGEQKDGGDKTKKEEDGERKRWITKKIEEKGEEKMKNEEDGKINSYRYKMEKKEDGEKRRRRRKK